MALVYLRGGLPVHVNGTTVNPVATERWSWSGGYANNLWFQNTGIGAIVVSFTEDDADNAIGISIAAGADYMIPAEIDSFYTRSVAAQTFQAVAFRRRG